MVKRKANPKKVCDTKQVAGNKQSEADWWSRGLAGASLAVSIIAIVLAVQTARWSSPYFFAAPRQIYYETTEANYLKNENSVPIDGQLTLRIYNTATTPARDVRALIQPISSKPDIKCDQTIKVDDAPAGGKLISIDRIPAGGHVWVTVHEDVNKYPSSFEPASGYKYQYTARVGDVQTEFGSIRCRHEGCIKFINALQDDNKVGEVVVPKEKIEQLLKGTNLEGKVKRGVDSNVPPH